MNTEHLKYILEIASCESINQAAENLNFQRQYLSKVLNNVEKQLGITIFERNPKGVVLTNEGSYFVTQAEQIVTLTDKLEKHFHHATAVYPEYKDAITCFIPNFSTPHLTPFHIIEEFQKQFPNVEISLLTKSGTEIISAVQENPTIPGAFLTASSIEEPITENIHIRPLKQVPLVAIASTNNPVAKRYKTISLELLKQYDLVSYDSELEQPRMLFPPSCKKLLQESIKYHVTTTNLFYGMLEQRQCFSVALFDENINDRFIQIPLEETVPVTLYLVYHQEALRSFPTKAFLNKVLSFYRKPLLL
ncbi:MAG: LysR family transcriptional regulator [Peptococcaceae bacterium]